MKSATNIILHPVNLSRLVSLSLVALILLAGGPMEVIGQDSKESVKPRKGFLQRLFGKQKKQQGEKQRGDTSRIVVPAPRSSEVETTVYDDDDFPTTPILRINTEMHTAAIIRIAVDAAETALATGSEDKTVKLWDLREGTVGELKRTLRLPSDVAGNVGKVFAVALSPDGSLVATGGVHGDTEFWSKHLPL